MSDDFKTSPCLNQRSAMESITPTGEAKKQDINQAHEVFRNNITAVEVIVKQIKNKNAKQYTSSEEKNIDGLHEEIEKLKTELSSAKRSLEVTKKCFSSVMFELGKQLETANQRELKRQTKNIVLQLEEEKMKTLLECKTNLVCKMSKEMLYMKRIAKLLGKSVGCIASASDHIHSRSEYEEFENDLLKRTNCAANTTDDPITYNTTTSS
ncbi:uncharacterized protein LOC116773134 [Danaus plexippus]|uniref:uncharacterized protein LOC116773134 n=1 Tax=Danaus plexippus TaxID=13037 RepID=UPI002AB169A9|nr:uncharacterized protein LOC116773134 [Danaus plexippus]